MTTKHIEEVLTPEARLVTGHPLEPQAVTNNNTGQPVVGPDGVAVTETYIGVAIPKGPEQDWKDTPWGQQIAACAYADWPNGEYRAPDFSWKVADGDSQIPNKRGKKPCEREGWPGHWVLHCSTRLSVRCFHVGKYEPHQCIQDKNEIKRGDYVRVLIQAKGNNPAQSPGVYLNPEMLELRRAGEQIMGDQRDAGEVFGGAPAAGGAPATPPPATPAPAAGGGAPSPAYDMLQPEGGAAPAPAPSPDAAPAPAPAPAPEASYNVNGQVFTESQLRNAGWNDQQIAQLPRAA